MCVVGAACVGCFLKRRRLSGEAFDVATKLLPRLKSSPYSYWSHSKRGAVGPAGGQSSPRGKWHSPGKGRPAAHLPCPPAPGHSQPLSERGAKSELTGPPLAQSARTHSDGKKELGDRQTDSRKAQAGLRFSAHIGVTETTPSAWTPLFPASQSLGLAIGGILDSFKGSRRGTGLWAPAFPPEKTRRSLRDGPAPIRVTSTLAAPVPAEIPAPPPLTCPCLPSAPPDLPPAPRRGPRGCQPSAGPQLCPRLGGVGSGCVLCCLPLGAASWGPHRTASPSLQPPFPVPRTPSRKCPPRPRSTQ